MAVKQIIVDDECIPDGGELIEAYRTPAEYIVLGDPDDVPDHNCDAMGCGSLSHVLFRWPRPEPRDPE